MQRQNSNFGALAQGSASTMEPTWRLPADWPICSLCDFHPLLQPVEPACEQLSEPEPCPICGTEIQWVVRSTKRTVLGYRAIIERWIAEAHR